MDTSRKRCSVTCARYCNVPRARPAGSDAFLHVLVSEAAPEEDDCEEQEPSDDYMDRWKESRLRSRKEWKATQACWTESMETVMNSRIYE